MNHYNLIECSDNYQDAVGSLYHFKRGEKPVNNGNIVDVTKDNSSSFKYKSSLLTGLTTEVVVLVLMHIEFLKMHKVYCP